ncbi:MAG: protein translocase subunit SecD [Dehalococcoidia bacterium]|nr:protein translocase subunit SecD [Dehalococcoidia bacterium]
MARREGWIFVIILVILALSLGVLLPEDVKIGRFERKGIQYGLDLEGGVRLIYQAKVPPELAGKEKEVIGELIAVIANRVNPLGVTEPNIEQRGTNQLIVELPNLSITDLQKERIGRIALLEFREEVDVKNEKGEVTGRQWVPATATINGVTKTLTSSYFKQNTVVSTGEFGGVELHFEWTEEGAQISKEVTGRLIGKPMGIFEGSGDDAQPLLGDDNQPIAPIVQAVITDRGRITGISLKEATELSKQLNAGRLPVPLELIGELTINPTLGEDFIKLSVKAGIIGIAAVMIFMIAYYRIPGIVAALALAFYGTVTLAIFKMLPVTLTLAGIGGFVLSVGMAVDANVLIFERMKEELLVKTTLSAAMESGFNRAWTAIWDSNVTTFIVCLVLYWVGDTIAFGGAVKGFALTLAIGVAVSMFTAIIASRTFLRMIIRTGVSKQIVLFSPYTGRKLA